MPILKQAKKAMRGDATKKVANDRIRKTSRASVKKVRDAIAAGNKKDAMEAMPALQKNLDKAVKAGVMKQNTASRTKARMTASIKKLK